MSRFGFSALVVSAGCTVATPGYGVFSGSEDGGGTLATADATGGSGSGSESASETSASGDGDGDTTASGDGDGTTSGDGDGTTSGDGDGTTAGDGDGTTSGDGDGTTSGDGDGTTSGDGDGTTSGDGDGTTSTTGDGDGTGGIPMCSDHAADPSLVLCIDFEESFGGTGTFIDNSSFNHDVAATNVMHVAGADGLGVRPDATSSMSTPSTPQLVGDAGMTWAAWANFDDLLGGTSPVARYPLIAKEGDWRLSHENDPKIECRVGNRIAATGLTGLVTPGQWVHFACTWDLSVIRAYIDGVEVAAQTPMSVNQTFDNSPVRLGSIGPAAPDDWLRGSMDHARVFRRVLTPAEVCNLAGDACP